MEEYQARVLVFFVLHGQRIEAAIGKKLDQYPAEEATVLTLLPRVSQATSMAAVQVKESGVKTKPKHVTDDQDQTGELEVSSKYRKRKRQDSHSGGNNKGQGHGKQKKSFKRPSKKRQRTS